MTKNPKIGLERYTKFAYLSSQELAISGGGGTEPVLMHLLSACLLTYLLSACLGVQYDTHSLGTWLQVPFFIVLISI